MATELLTHAKTGVIQMGWPKLYEAVTFKGNKDDDKSAKKDDKKKNESTPAYGFPVLLDKDDPDHMRTVRILQKLSKNAEANAIALKKWGKKDRIVSNDGLKDADEDEILDGDKTVLMTDKYPNRANHFYVNFSRSSKAGRPGIRYIDDEGILRELPEPILGTKEDIQAAQANLNDARAAYATADEDAREEAKTLVLEATRNLEEAQERDAKAKEVKVLWDKLVYPGQNVQASVTARAWKTQTGSGVSYRLDNLTIVGGGVRDGSFEYDEDFTDEDIEALIAWRDKHVNAKPSKADDEAALLADTDFDEADSDDEVDEDTGEIAEELGIPEARVSRYVRYNTHFLGVHDLVPESYDGDPYERLMPGMLTVSAEQAVYRKVCIKLLRELFDTLPKKNRDILGKSYGVFGYPEATLKEIGMYHMMKESAVEKAKNRAVEKLREAYPGSRLQVWRTVHRMMRRPVLPDK